MLRPRLVDARRMFGVPAAFWKSGAAAGDLVRYVAPGRGCTSLALPTPSRPRDPPRVVQGQGKVRKVTGQITSCAAGPRHWEWEAGNSFWKGVGIIGVLLTAGIWTICVDGSGTFPAGQSAISREGATVRISTSEAISRPPRHSEFKGTPQMPI